MEDNNMILNETYDEILNKLDIYSLNEGFFSDRKKKREEKRKEKRRAYVKKWNDQLPEEDKKIDRDYYKKITNKFKSWKSSPYTFDNSTKDILVVAAYNDITNEDTSSNENTNVDSKEDTSENKVEDTEEVESK